MSTHHRPGPATMNAATHPDFPMRNTMKTLVAIPLAALLWAASASGATLRFDNANGQVVVGDQPALKMTDAATFEAWIKPSAPSSVEDSGIILNREGEYEIAHFGDGSIQYAVAIATADKASWNWVNTGFIAPTQTWSHIALTYDGSWWRFYADGLLVHTNARTGVTAIIGDTVTGQNEFRIGGRQSTAQFFGGELDEVRVWNIARGAADIAATMHRSLAGNEPGLAAYYPFNEGAGTVTFDAGGHGLTGELFGGVAWNPLADAVAVPIALTEPVGGPSSAGAEFNGRVEPNGIATTSRFDWGPGSTAVEFDGVDDMVHVEKTLDLANRSFSIEFWARRQRADQVEFLFNTGHWGTRSQLHMGWRSATRMTFAFFLDDLNVRVDGREPGWHHWAFTYDSGTRERRIYQDGVLAGSDIAGGNYVGAGPVRLGRSFASNSRTAFAGAMDEVRVWQDVVLDPGTIRQWMHAEVDDTHTHFANLEAYWPMNEGEGRSVADVSGHDYTGSFVENPAWIHHARPVLDLATTEQSFSTGNGVIDLDGEDDHMAAPSGTWFSGDFSVEMWVFLRRYSNYAELLDFGNGPGDDNILLSLGPGTSGQLQIYVYRGSSGSVVTSPDPVPLNRWVHLAATQSGGVGRLHVDGVEVAQGPLNIPNAVHRTMNFVGRPHWSGDTHVDGVVDDVRIWNTSLPAATVEAWRTMENLATHPNAAMLGAQWRFNEAAGTGVLDTRGLRPGLLVNGVERGVSVRLHESLGGLEPGTLHHVRAWADNTNGISAGRIESFVTPNPLPGTALRFDGVDDHVRMGPFGPLAPLTEVTIEFWQRVHSVRKQSPFSLEPDLTANRMQVHTPWENGIVYWDFGNISGNGRLTYTPPESLVGQWNHFAFVASQSGNFMRIYRNGVLEAQKTGMDIREPGTFDLILGRYTLSNVSYYFDGELDEFRIWNTARTEAQIQSDLNRRLDGPDASLVVYYRMDEGTGATLVDAGPNALDGDLINGPEWQGSDVPLGRALPRTGAATDVAFGSATLNGTVNGEGTLPVDVWFEYGTRMAPVPGSAVNRVQFFTTATISALSQVNFNGTSVHEQSFANIDLDVGSGAMWPGGPVDNFAARFTARIFAPESGTYTFTLVSDDGSQLFVNGALLVNHDGPHARTEKFASTYLTAGHHDVDVRYFEQGQIAAVRLLWEGPGIAKEAIPPVAFLRHEPVHDRTTPVVTLPANAHVQSVSNTVHNLLGAGTYHYRLVAANPNGTNYGANRSLTMPHPSGLSAVQFDGNNDYLRVNAFPDFPRTNLTVEFWIRPDLPVRAFATILSYAVSGDDNHFFIDARNMRDFQVGVSGGRSGVFTAPGVDDGQWHHLATSWRSSDGRLDFHVDGALVFTTNNVATGRTLTSGGSFVAGQDQDSVGGGFDPNQAFVGAMDDLRIWDAYRSEAEIGDAWQRLLTGNEPGLEAWYRMDEGAGGLVADSSGNGHAANLVSGAFFVTSGAGLYQPQATTFPATPVLATLATLRGEVNPAGLNTVAFFEYGPTVAYGSQTEPLALGSGIAALPVVTGLTNLEPGTTYHFRMVAFNDAGRIEGEDQSFTTLLLGCGWPIASKVNNGSAHAPKHAVDEEGNAYVSGLFSGEATFKSTLRAEPGEAATNAFVGKLARGADWLWSVKVPVGAGGSIVIHDIAVDAARHVHVAGQFSGTATFGTNMITAESNGDLFVAKLDSEGRDWLWARAAGAAQPDQARALEVTPSGTVYVAGQFGGSVSFGTNGLASSGARDLFVASLDAGGNWLWARGAGGALDDEIATAMVLNSAGDVFLAGHFEGTANFGPAALTARGGTDMFVAGISRTGTWFLAARAGGAGADTATGLAIDPAEQLYLLGQFADTADYNDTVQNLNLGGGTRLFVAKLNQNAGMLWYAQAGTGSADSIAVDRDDRVYIAGDFTVTAQFGEPVVTSVVSSGNSDVFLAQLDAESGAWNWSRKIGSSGSERRGSVAVDRDGGVVVSGSFQNTVQIGFVLLSSTSERDIFLARLTPEPIFEHNTFIIGQAVTIPALAQDPGRTNGGAFAFPGIVMIEAEHSDSTALNSFVWSEAEHKLYAVRPVTAIVKWPLTSNPTNSTSVATCVGRSVWPVPPQYHVANVPVDLEPAVPGFPLKFLGIAFTTINGAAVDAGTKTFQAPAPGRTVLQFLDSGGQLPNPAIHPSLFEVVESVPWNDPAHLLDNQPAVIGQPLGHPGHNDPTGRNGFVFFERSFYDGVGTERAHQRSTRMGPIFPVNRDTVAVDDDLVVVWFRTSARSGVAWPDRPVRYLAGWPMNADDLVLASGAGSGVLDLLDFPSKRVYHQPDPALPGHNPNEEHAALYGEVLHALRNDLNGVLGESEPYTLLKHRDPSSGAWAMKVFRVVATNASFTFHYSGEAGQQLLLPAPLSLLNLCGENNRIVSGPGFQDYLGRIYARAAGPDVSGTNIVARYFYPLQPGFHYDLDGNGVQDVPVGTCLPWLDRQTGVPVDVTYEVNWPTGVPTLQIGETLLNARFGLPDIRNFASARVVFDQANPVDTNALHSLVRLYDPLSERTLNLPPGFSLPAEVATTQNAGRQVFTDLPYAIRARLFHDPLNNTLSFGGLLDEHIRFGGPDNPLLLVNVLSPRERDRIKQLSADSDFQRAIDDLYHLTRNPNRLDLNVDGLADQTLLIGLTTVTNHPGTDFETIHVAHEPLGDLPKALTAGPGTGSGFVTIVENDDADLNGLPVTLHVIRVEGGPARGDLKVIPPDNVFDEKLTIRHSSDFGAEPQHLEFEWYYQQDPTGQARTNLPTLVADGTVDNFNGWIRYTDVPPGINGFNDITLGDGGTSSLLTLADTWIICRYRGYVIAGQTQWSDWVGVIGGGEAQLAEGWVKRVLDGLNPFEARSDAFHENESVTFASMLQQAGSRHEGDIAFNPSGGNINQIGLIEAYTTVLRRARRLSIDGVPAINYGPANDALLLAGGRIADLYMLLGNEAFADAADPTIGFRTDSLTYGTLAPSIFTFQNQLDSLLEEELGLLRGRDNRSATVRSAPVYNRLFWNFTRDEGEVAYAQSYNVTDQNTDGFIDAEDARIAFPQGHGDAWGHYLTALKTYYGLLRNPFFDWVPRTEFIQLAGVPVEVDYLDERKFARAAAAKARTGADIVDLTYRLNYVDDPEGQFQGYKDTDPDRAWGVSDWASRAGSGAFLDWVAANAILPAIDPDPTHTGITRVDRTTVPEIDEITAAFDAVQGMMDKADGGLNPLGLAKNVVPFDIDPARVSAGDTHFEQIYERAIDAVDNAVTVFNHANQLSESLRRVQDTVNQFTANTAQQERDFKNRLIEIFGYPYAGDIGPGRTYPSGYDGPDLYHWMYVNTTRLNGETAPPATSITGIYAGLTQIDQTNDVQFFPEDFPPQTNPDLIVANTLNVSYPLSEGDYAFTAPAEWGQRRAPGEIQLALSDLVQGEARLRQAQLNYDNLISRIEDEAELLAELYGLRSETISIRNKARNSARNLAIGIAVAKAAQRGLEFFIDAKEDTAEAILEGIPKVLGFSNDATAPARGAIKGANTATSLAAKVGVSLLEGGIEAQFAAVDTINDQAELEIDTQNFRFEIVERLRLVEQLLREEVVVRAEAFALGEAVQQHLGRFQAAVAGGVRVTEARVIFRKNVAGDTQVNRYRDMTFRIFRNDAIQKYRAQFDLATMYVFLAGVAYDYETQLLGEDAGSGRDFLTDIIRQRSLGQVEGGVPVAGRHGLADPLARLNLNFNVLKGQLGFNNPQTETGRFSLRNELFRMRDTSDASWRAELRKHIVPNLWDVPEFRRYCRPFAPESAGPQPGMVIRFPTTVTFGLNYFGWPLGGGDSSYDSSQFATKVRSVGVWFSNYDGNGLSQTPRIYMVPVGADVFRAPDDFNLSTREWRVVDQKIPVPFPIGFSSLNNPAWIPMNDTLSDTFAEVRLFSRFRAYHDSGFFNESEAINDSRLIGRSVWNTDWMLIIPGGTFLFDPNQGLDMFINSVDDIRIFFQTYAYSGN